MQTTRTSYRGYNWTAIAFAIVGCIVVVAAVGVFLSWPKAAVTGKVGEKVHEGKAKMHGVTEKISSKSKEEYKTVEETLKAMDKRIESLEEKMKESGKQMKDEFAQDISTIKEKLKEWGTTAKEKVKSATTPTPTPTPPLHEEIHLPNH